MAVKAAERENKRAPLNMRTTAKLRDALEREASKADRSLAQEVESRLERSFEDDELLKVFIGDQAHIQILIRAIAASIKEVELIRGDRCVDSYETRWLARQAAERILESLLGPDFGPPNLDEFSEWPDDRKARFLRLGEIAAMSVLREFGLLNIAPKHLTSYKDARDSLALARTWKAEGRADSKGDFRKPDATS